MLNFFRRRDTVARLILGFFLVVICVAMVMFLIPQGAGSDASAPLGQQTVATVNGTAISGQDLTQEMTRQENGQQYPATLIPLLGHQVLESMIQRQALLDEAQRMGFNPTNQEIIEAARSQAPQLYPNGNYVGDQQAEQFLSSYQLTLNEFENQLRQNLMIGKLFNLVTDPIQISGDAVHQEFEKDNQKAVFDYVVFNPDQLASQVTVTPQALQSYFDQHKANYNSPEKRKIEVLLANTAQIGAGIPVSQAQVDQYYKQNISTYSHPEEVKVSHILIKYPNTSPTAAEIAATKTKAEDVLKQVQAKGADFAALAKKYSQDDASASQGGELGFIQRNQTVPNFEKAAFSLPVGAISDLVQTEYGFHIIKVEAHTPAHVQPESEVHDQIVAQLQRDMAADKAQNLMNQAENLAQTTSLPQVAKQLGLQYFATQPIAQGDPVAGIGVNPDFAGAVFATGAGGITHPVQVAQGFAMAKVDQVIPPGPQTLDEVRDAVTTDYKQAQSKQLAQSRAQALQQAAAKEGLKAAAAQQHVAVKTSTALTRADSLPDVGSMSSFADQLFSLKPGQVGPVATNGDSRIVYALDTLQEPTAADFTQQQASISQKLLGDKRNSVFGAFADAVVSKLQKAGKIKIDNAAFQRVMGTQGGQPGAPTPAPPQPMGLGS